MVLGYLWLEKIEYTIIADCLLTALCNIFEKFVKNVEYHGNCKIILNKIFQLLTKINRLLLI